MIYMAGAYLIIWAASFALIISMLRRQNKLNAELSALREIAEEKSAGGKG